MAGTIDHNGKGKEIMYDSEGDDLPATPPRIIRALVVDDVDSIRKIHQDKLRNLGMETRSVKTGQEAIKIVCVEEIYDLILIRRLMPEIDGIQLTMTLRDMDYPATIIGVSHPLTKLEKEEFCNAGLDLCVDDESPLTDRTLRLIVTITPCHRIWTRRNFYQPFAGSGPPSGPGSTSTSRDVFKKD